MAKKQKLKEFTDRDRQIYKAGLNGKYIKVNNDTERTVYLAGINDLVISLNRENIHLKKENETLKSALTIQTISVQRTCEVTKIANSRLFQAIMQKDETEPVEGTGVTISRQLTIDTIEELRLHNRDSGRARELQGILNRHDAEWIEMNRHIEFELEELIDE